ncbi:MAG: TolC family protein [Deltaproteobacteria bacterium]
MLLNIDTAADRIPHTVRSTLPMLNESGAGDLFSFKTISNYLIASFPATILFLLLIPMTALCEDVNPDEPEIPAAEEIEILTLEEALDIAFRDNKNIDNALLEVEKAGDAIKAARTRLFPEFDFSLYELYHLTEEAFTFQKGVFGDFAGIGPIPAETVKIRTAPDFTTFLTATVGQPISHLYEISLLVRQREVQKELSGEDLRFRRQEVADRVKKEYYNILKSQSSLEAVQEKIVFLKELYILVNRYVEVERALESESLEVKARLGRAEYDEFKLRNELATEKERLNNLMGRDIETPFAVTPVPSAEPIVIDIENAEELALFQRPEVRAAKLGIEFAENEVRLKKSKYIPEIGVEFQYTANPDIELLPENIATIGLFAKWDVFDWGRKQKEIAEKKRGVLQARNELDEAESTVLIDVNSKIRKLEEAAVLINVTEMEQAAARERLRVEMNKYREGSALLQGVLEAESSLEEKNSAYQKAVLGYWTARAELEKAMGEE